jgi:hypothetical protein
MRSGKRVQEERGQMLILGVLAMTLILLIGVLVVDFGMWFSGRASVTNAVDQATMSGSLNLPKDGAGAAATALDYIQANDSDIKPADVTTTFRCIAGDRNNNGLPDTPDITVNCPQVAAGAFTCISGLCYALCTFGAANAQCNTIVVQGSKSVPFGFASIFGVSSQEAAGFTSAACRGGCGAAPLLPLDLVMIIDRTGSMSCNPSNGVCDPSSDLGRAEAGAKSVLTFFDPEVQHVALGVLGPSSTTTRCTGANAGGLGILDTNGGTWLPVPLSSDYQNSDGSLNNSSLIVKTINCLQASGRTDLGDPIKAAMDYLQTSPDARHDVKKGIILMTDGAANLPLGIPGSTGFRPCTAQAAVTSSAGDNNGYEVSPANACADDAVFAQDGNAGNGSGTSTSTSCGSSGKDKHRFSGFGLGPLIPPSPTPTVDGIQIKLDAWASSGASTRRVCVRLSWNSGTSWTNTQQVDLSGTTEATYPLGAPDDTWGHTWSLSDLSDLNFRVEVTDVASNTSTTFNLDTVQVNVSYHVPNPSTGGPCEFASQKADAARAADIELFTIGYGLWPLGATDGDRCWSTIPADCVGQTNPAYEGPGSQYECALTTHLLADMANGPPPGQSDDGGDGPQGLPPGCPAANPAAIASENADGDHFLCEAKGNDLQSVFQQAAQLLASGSRLVKVPF